MHGRVTWLCDSSGLYELHYTTVNVFNAVGLTAVTEQQAL